MSMTTEEIYTGAAGEESISFWSDPGLAYSIISYYITGIIGFVGNTLVVIVILASKMRKKPTNWFLVQQSVLDAGGSLSMLAIAATLGRIHTFSGTGDSLRCLFLESGFLMWGFYMASNYNLLVITVERYCAVVHAIFHKNNFTTKVYIILLIIPGLVGFLFNFISVGLAKVMDGQCMIFVYNAPWEGVVLGWAAFLLQFFIPLVIMIYCYSRMAHYLLKMNKNLKSGDKGDSSTHKATINVIKTLFVVAACFFFCWVWNSVYFLLVSMGYVSDFTGPFYHFTVTAVNVNCIANPFIYALKYREFKVAAKTMFCKGSGKVGAEPNTTSTTA